MEETGGVIIFSCDKYLVLGGLCDRLNGIVSLYKYCKIAAIPFKINFTEPFMLEEILSPNVVDWRLNKQPDYRHSILLYLAHDHTRWRSFEDYVKYHDRFLRRMIHNKLSHPTLIWSNSRLVAKEEFPLLFNELFKPTMILQNAIHKYSEDLAQNYIGVTTRFQNLLGDFDEMGIKPLAEKQQELYIERCINKIDELHTKYPSNKVLVTSDSRKFLEAANKLPYVYTIPGKLVHMSYYKDKDITTYLKGFVDLMLLSKSERIFLLITGKMYRSGFAETASYIGNKQYEDIRF